MNLFKKKIKVVTHSGTFHADDVFACATLSIWADKNNSKLEIVRDRDPQIIADADIAIDVGMEYNPDQNKFDHHQKGGAGIRENGIPYASFGLVWKKYGEEVCGSKDVADRIEKDLVVPIDAIDSGVRISNPNEFGIYEHRTSGVISNFNLTNKENNKFSFKQFEKALLFSKEIIKREIAWADALIDGQRITEKAIKDQNEPAVLILEEDLEWHEAVCNNKKIKLVVSKHSSGKYWCIQTGRDNLEDYNSDRANFPKSWWGLRENDLANVSGIKDASFCTNGGWYGTAKSKEGAIKMTEKALQNLQN